MAHDVFISYSSTDQQAALAVLHGLESAGIRCWMAPRDIGPGAIWAQAIMDGISDSRVLVVVFSSHANRSSHVLTEVDAAVRKGVMIVPFRIEDVMPDGAMEYHLRTRHWLDALTPELESHVVDLADQIRPLLAAERHPREPSTLPERPLAGEMRQVRRSRGFPSLFGRILRHPRLALATAAIVALGGWWFTRPRPVRDTGFTVREVSSGGGNESTFRVTARELRFFEGPDSTAEISQRDYRTEFPEEATRYIKTEITLLYDPPGRQVRFPFSCVIAREGAQVIANLALTATVQPEWNESFHTAGWGNAAPGSWEPGRYRAECRYGERLVARDWFTIREGGLVAPRDAPVAGSTTLAPLRARLAAIRLFESGYGTVARDQRIYASTFLASRTRYINVETILSYQRTSTAVQASLTCRYLRNRTDEVARVVLQFDMGIGETERWSSGGWGNRTPGTWQPGEYLVACDDGQVTLGQVGFTVR
ncbi:MAG TPA: toll/interleukin-1 receptor domain-containing protein [Gemmatimonadales bacterium]|nr:toll/interleukin-1 receptor domain-containing protein [Gemmatimonadales bacterium]